MKTGNPAPPIPDESRRRLLAGLGLIMLAPGVGASAAMQASLRAAPAAPAVDASALLRQFMRMRNSPDGAPVMWVYSGVLVVKPEGQLARAVTRINGVSYTLGTPREDGAWDWELEEVGYFCDLDTGAVLEQMTNPFTGEQVRPRHYRSPQRLLFSGSQVLPGVQLPPGIDYRGEITRLAQVGNVTAITEDLYVRAPATPATPSTDARPERISTSLATFTTDTRSFRRPDPEWLDCMFSYTTLNSFVGWLGMGATPGVQNMRLIGAKCRVDDHHAVPDSLRERIVADHPGFLKA